MDHVFSDFNRTAFEYAMILSDVIPTVPLTLAGYSCGDFLAFEVARQLM